MPFAHTAVGIEVILDAIEVSEVPREEDAVRTVALVLVLITAAREDDAVLRAELVFALTLAVPAVIAVPRDEDAVVRSDSVASEPDERPAPVRVRVPFVHTSAASDPKVVSERVPLAQTFAGMEVIDVAMDESVVPREVEAVNTVALVFALTTAARDDDAVLVFVFTAVVTPAVAEFVFVFTTAAIELEAVVTSDSVASEPEERPAPVRVRVPYVHTSAAVSDPPPEVMLDTAASILVASWRPIEPGAVSVELATFQTFAGMEEMLEAIDERVVPRDVEAVRTQALVFAIMTAASDEVAVVRPALVFAFTLAVPAVTAAAIEVDAVVMSDCTASEPDERPAPVNVRVPFVHTSAAREPKVVRLRVPFAQTFAGMEAMLEAIDEIEVPRELDAASTTVLVFALTTAARDEVAVVSPELVFAFTTAATELEAVVRSDNVASEPDERPAPVRVRVPFVQTSAASEPKVVSERVPFAQTFAGIDVMLDAIEVRVLPREDDAAFVFAFTSAVIDDEAVLVFAFTAVVTPAVAEFVFALTLAVPAVIAVPRDEDAVVRSDSVASEPDERPAPVRVRVPFVHTSAASDPKVVSERVPLAQTFAGMEVIDVAMDESVVPREVEAVNTVALVFAFITAASDEVAVLRPELVFAFTLAVPAVTATPREEDAVVSSAVVASDPEERPAPVRVRVPFVQTSAASEPKVVSERVPFAQTLPGIEVIDVAMDDRVVPSEVEAVNTVALVFALMTAARDEVAVVSPELVLAFTLAVLASTAAPMDEDAVVRSESVASEPEERPAPVRVRVPFVHTSAASDPKVVRLRVPFAQTLAGMEVILDAIEVREIPREEEAVRTVALVFALMTAASEDDAL